MNSNELFHLSHPLSPSEVPLYYPDETPNYISLPEARLSKYLPPTNDYPFSHSPKVPSESFISCSPSEPVPEPKIRIPRPPNAFMLFRSHMLKTKAIPPSAERRQQQLSKVAGECWNLLTQEERKPWHDEAARLLKEHQRKYPDYKFTPSAKGSSRKQVKNDLLDKANIRELREKYTQVLGPAAAPERRRKTNSKGHLLPRSEPDPEIESLPELAFTASPTSSMPSSPSSSISDTSLPPVFPNPSYPHFPNHHNGYPNYYFTSGPSIQVPYTLLPFPLAPPSLSSDAARSNELEIGPTVASFHRNNIHDSPSEALRKIPPFTGLTERGSKSTSEAPFLSPLVPSPEDLANGFVEQSTHSEIYSFKLASPSSPSDSHLKFGGMDTAGSLSFSLMNDDFFDINAMWNFVDSVSM